MHVPSSPPSGLDGDPGISHLIAEAYPRVGGPPRRPSGGLNNEKRENRLNESKNPGSSSRIAYDSSNGSTARSGLTGGEHSMAIEYEALAPGLALLCLLGDSLVVVMRAGFGGKTGPTRAGVGSSTQAEGPIFYVMMEQFLLVGALGVVLTLRRPRRSLIAN